MQNKLADHSNLLLPHQSQALLKLLSSTTPDILLCHFRRYYDGFVYNADGNVEIEDHQHYRDIDNFFESLRVTEIQTC